MTLQSFFVGVLALCLIFTGTSGLAPVRESAAQESVFSGPQEGEVLPPFTVRNVVGPLAGQQTDPIALAEGRPVLLIFVHKRERPAFGLANVLTRFAATRESAGLQRWLIHLSGDQTETESWLKRISNYFEAGTPVAVSVDGVEGPGAYGLNRNVTLTVIVGREGKVTSNFALVQPSIQADGPRIAKAIVEATGGGEVPDLTKFLPRGMRDRMVAASEDTKLRELLRGVIQKDASEETVAAAARKVEEYVAENPKAGKELGQITGRVVGSPRFSDYGTPPAREHLKKWARKFAPPEREKKARDSASDSDPEAETESSR